MIRESSNSISLIFDKSSCRQYFSALCASLGMFSVAIHLGWSSPYVPILLNGNYTFQITETEASWITLAEPIGAISGSILICIFGNYCSRKFFFGIGSFMLITSWHLIAQAESSTPIILGRVLGGTTEPMFFTMYFTYVSEISHSRLRGHLGSLGIINWYFGILVSNILGVYLTLRMAAYLSTIVPSILLLFWYWIPASPYYHAMVGNIEKTKKSLETLYGTQNVEDEFNRIIEGIGQQQKSRGTICDLFRVKSNRHTFMVGLVLDSLLQYNGSTVIKFHCQSVFKHSKTVIEAGHAAIVYCAWQLFFAAMISIFVDLGRRPLVLFTTGGTVLFLFLNGAYIYLNNHTDVDLSEHEFLQFVTMLFYAMFSVGMEIACYVIHGELFATNIKVLALGLLELDQQIIILLGTYFYQWCSNFGEYIPFFTFAAICFVGFVYEIFFVFETKGKTLENIQGELREKHEEKVKEGKQEKQTK